MTLDQLCPLSMTIHLRQECRVQLPEELAWGFSSGWGWLCVSGGVALGCLVSVPGLLSRLTRPAGAVRLLFLLMVH